MSTLQNAALIATASGAVVTAIGVVIGASSALLAYRNYKSSIMAFIANIDRQKKQETIKILLEWNQNVLQHRKALEARFPGIINDPHSSLLRRQLSVDEAVAIYLSTEEDNQNFEMKFHIIEMLNFFEVVAASYLKKVADREMIEESFKSTLKNYVSALENYKKVVIKARGYDPWSPLTKLLKKWEHPRAEGSGNSDSEIEKKLREVVIPPRKK